MSYAYKLCTRCQFVVESSNNVCTTCGGSAFEETDAPIDRGDEPAVVAWRPHIRHIGSASARRELKDKITGEQQKLRAFGSHRTPLKNKFKVL